MLKCISPFSHLSCQGFSSDCQESIMLPDFTSQLLYECARCELPNYIFSCLSLRSCYPPLKDLSIKISFDFHWLVSGSDLVRIRPVPHRYHISACPPSTNAKTQGAAESWYSPSIQKRVDNRTHRQEFVGNIMIHSVRIRASARAKI